MEAIRVSSFHSFPCFSGAGFDDTHSSKFSFSSSVLVKNGGGEIKLVGNGDRRKSCVVSSNLQFSDGGHLQYYQSPPKAGLKEKEKEKKKDSEKKALKKKLKLIKGMSKDLLKFSSMGYGVEAHDGLISEIKEKKISEATEILLTQLKELKAEEKELKRKKKEEKAKLKAESSSSSSSSSSDSECGEVVDMSSLRAIAVAEPIIDEPHLKIETPSLPLMGIGIQDQREEEYAQNAQNAENAETQTSTSCRSEGSGVVMVGASTEKIEVCMGGKCKKSGATALLEEFQERVGVEGVVVGCKCMGKCRDGPNVRIVNQCSSDGDVRPPQTSPLCIGVGLEDVGVILGNFLGEERKDLGLMVA